ncbi:MAG: phosphoribosylamine--glycine ligase, partial [Candidatus Omnitrophica bacterium]|nr:phosphoribosylamine--glycine ligase [Candidatus Omnitrophota bacterium]
SVIGITDGDSVQLFPSSQDHKRIFEGDNGPNTGGMGAYSPTPVVSETLENEVLEKVFVPAVRELKSQGIAYQGFLYAGIMVTKSGFGVLEFNVRLGDPEAQVLLPRMKNDLLEVLFACVEGKLSTIRLEWKEETVVCVVIASGGYPADYEVDKKIAGLSMAKEEPGVLIFHAGTKRQNGELVTAGGRVLNVVGHGRGMFEALSRTYNAVNKIFFDKMYYRKDIGHRAVRVFR